MPGADAAAAQGCTWAASSGALAASATSSPARVASAEGSAEGA
jgi:hypothetical protein